ncbi:MAG: Gfo/Idh/MocA family oxidoreductase [Clostridia bacterium]|nr:Gfo/Idh/MocA family oxidoreductase [Clostridia bacterium]
MKKIAIVGFGSRGQMFGKLIRQYGGAELVAIAETEESNRKRGVEEFGLSEAVCYPSADAFFAQGKIVDAIFLCTQDKQHYEMAMQALELGYDICLEKPAAATIEDCIAIRDKANELGRKVMLTHVVRYAPFYGAIKRMIIEGKLGDVVTINQTENIAYWHFALSYVRGPWRKMFDSTPTIIAKCCHDLDIILWLLNKKCTHVSSFGSLQHFNPQNAPKGSAEYCADCEKAVKEKCLYNAYKVYPERMKRGVVGGTARFIGKDINEVLDEKQDAICKCVYHSDNDAVDHQVVNMVFENGATAHLTMTAFSEECYRFVKVHGTKGEVYGNFDDGILYYTEYGKPQQKIDSSKLVEFNTFGIDTSGGHGGGDTYLYFDFIDYITKDSPSFTRTTIDDSIESHILGFKAEESRLNNGQVMEVKG